MILSFFKKQQPVAAGRALYAAAVDQARAAAFYADLRVPDTLEGRFEMVTLHVYLILHRLKSDQPDAKAVGQRLFDVMFENMDDTLRELGVGDLSMARKMRKLAENFYGRVGAYEEALSADAPTQLLEKALARNIYEDTESQYAPLLANYIRTAVASIGLQPIDEIISGNVSFPDAEIIR